MSFGPPAATVVSNFYSPTYGINSTGDSPSYNAMPRYGRTANERLIAFAVARSGFRGMRKAMRVLNGAAPGTDATETFSRVSAPPAFADHLMGGVRTLEVVTANSGVTTASQVTYIQDKIIDMVFDQEPGSYPVDTSGNGGGGKAGR